MMDFTVLRHGLAALDASAAHAASGESRPTVDEIFAPEHHAGALDPNVTIVLGARGAGKSFWAGVLGNDPTRAAAAEVYPNLGLEEYKVQFGFTGLIGDGSVSKATIDSLVERGDERSRGRLLWRCVILRALRSALEPNDKPAKLADLMERYDDPEDWEIDCASLDARLIRAGRKVLVLFDALDALATEWRRLRDLIDALLEVAWEIRGFRSTRAKLFLRPDQMRDLGLRFVELPKLLAGATNLRWSGEDLYGMMFSRLGRQASEAARAEFNKLLGEEGVGDAPSSLRRTRNWPPAYDRRVQARIFTRLAGNFMGRSNKKGRTYDWPLNHLADGHGEVTPRSFMTLMIFAARSSPSAPQQAINAEGIRSGLREASKVRVNQLELEFPWIKRVLAPLARLQVPCTPAVIETRWAETETIDAVMKRAEAGEFLPPYDASAEGEPAENLIARLVRLGILTVRNDGRFDMPDLFRVAARLLKKGGVTPVGPVAASPAH